LLNQTAKQKPTTGVKQIPTPSFSSSITSSKEEREAAEAAPPAPTVEKVVNGKMVAKPANDRKKEAAVPTLTEVQAYAAEQHPNSPEAHTEAAAFHDHYQSNGWRVSGKTPMADWRASFRGWMRRRPQFQAANSPASTQAPPTRARTSPKTPDPNRWS
jgi:hypothetical protein